MQVLDYSAGFPGAQAIARAKFAGAVRYIGFPGRRKCTTRSEYEDFSRHGLGMALVYQDSTGDWLGGYGGGQAAARRAREHANAIGFPRDIPIYFAVDRDIVSARDFDTVMSYLDGAASVLGGPRCTGVYGEHDIVKRAIEEGHARYGWQTVGWSRGRRYTGAHLFQRAGQIQVGGIQCDVNDVLQSNWGQHNAGEDMPLTQADADLVASTVWAQLFPHLDPNSGQPALPAWVLLRGANMGAWEAVKQAADDPSIPEFDYTKLAELLLPGMVDALKLLPAAGLEAVADAVADEQDRRAAARATTPVPPAGQA